MRHTSLSSSDQIHNLNDEHKTLNEISPFGENMELNEEKKHSNDKEDSGFIAKCPAREQNFENSRGSEKRHESEYFKHSGFDRNISFGRRRQYFTFDNKSSFVNKKRNDQFKAHKHYKDLKEANEFRFGNYHQYYGYRNQGSMDSRLVCMKREWFDGKVVLDIGCNSGHLTLAIAKNFSPRCIIGVDIDSTLVKMAKSNTKHYINPEDISDEDFPLNLVLAYGPVAQAIDPKERYPVGDFPFNVQFLQGNYVLPCDEMLEWQEPYFDTILCLSLTKWIHLNWGDVGIKRMFQRIYAQLHPGGCLILEAQEYKSYARKKKITEETFKHYKEIQLYPEMFNEYLIKEVGFASCELIDTPAHSSKGFSRPIYLFIKGTEEQECSEIKPKHVFYYDSDSQLEYSDVEQLSE